MTVRHGDTTTAVAIKCFGGIDGQGTWTAASRPLMRSEQLRQRWKGVADTPGARIAVPCRGFSEWTHDFFVPPVPGAVFYLAALRYQGGFAFLTRDSSGFAPLEFHHRTLIALDEAGAVAWASSVGDDLSALDTTINGASCRRRQRDDDRGAPPALDNEGEIAKFVTLRFLACHLPRAPLATVFKVPKDEEGNVKKDQANEMYEKRKAFFAVWERLHQLIAQAITQAKNKYNRMNATARAASIIR